MTQALLSLQPSDLRSLAAGIRSGRLNAPYLPSGIERYLNVSVAAGISTELAMMNNLGMSSSAVAWTLDLLASTIDSRPALADIVDLVTTAPDASRTANRDTAVVVSELFRKAGTSVLVAGYAVHQGQKVFRVLADRMNERPQLAVRMFLDIQRGSGETSAPEELVRRFVHRFRTAEWPMGAPVPQLFYDPRATSLDRNGRGSLHAKCIVVDEVDVFVSSANFTQAAQDRNVEVGLLLHSPTIARRVANFFRDLLAGAWFQQIA